jgi:hypothetical protein
MGAENEHGTRRNLGNSFDENRTTAAKLLDHVSIVDNLVMHVDRRSVSFQSQFDDIDRTDNAGTESARTNAEKRFTLSLNSHLFPKLLNLQNSIISKPAFWRSVSAGAGEKKRKSCLTGQSRGCGRE